MDTAKALLRINVSELEYIKTLGNNVRPEIREKLFYLKLQVRM
jgi:hypothetical protein